MTDEAKFRIVLPRREREGPPLYTNHSVLAQKRP